MNTRAEKHLNTAAKYLRSADDFNRQAADEIIAARKADSTLTFREVGEHFGKSEAWAHQLVRARTNLQDAEDEFRPFGGADENAARYDRQIRTVLKDPERRSRAIAELAPKELETLHRDTTEAMVSRARAVRKEHQPEPTAGQLIGEEKFDPAENWADTVIIRVHRNARELDNLIRRAGGLLFGSMGSEEAFNYLNEAERMIAEARAAVQENLRDERVGV